MTDRIMDQREQDGAELRKGMREELGHPDINQRVQLWARKMGIDVMLLQRESKDEDLYKVGNVPWTISFSEWVRGQAKLFYRECHGTTDRGECCAAAMIDGRFDKWLWEFVMREDPR